MLLYFTCMYTAYLNMTSLINIIHATFSNVLAAHRLFVKVRSLFPERYPGNYSVVGVEAEVVLCSKKHCYVSVDQVNCYGWFQLNDVYFPLILYLCLTCHYTCSAIYYLIHYIHCYRQNEVQLLLVHTGTIKICLLITKIKFEIYPSLGWKEKTLKAYTCVFYAIRAYTGNGKYN